MNSSLHVLPLGTADAGPPESAAVRSVYLDAYLEPFRQWLERETVTELLVNAPGEVWIEDAEHPGMQRVLVPEVTDRLLQRLAEQVARISHQGINREHPLLAATLPDGARIQLCGPPATRRHWAMAIRRHRLLDLPLDAYDRGPITPQDEIAPPDRLAEPIAFLRDAIRRRRTILVAGGTSTGKTTFLNAMLREIPRHERVVVVEDTAELTLHCPPTTCSRRRCACGPTASSLASCAAPKRSASCARSTPAIPARSLPSTPIRRAVRSNRSR